MTPPEVAWQDATKVFEDTVALEHFTLVVAPGETVALVGRSGSGKTTALRLVNRLLDASSGRVLVDGVDVKTVSAVALRRRMGFVAARAALLPHLDARDNVELPLRAAGWARERGRARADVLLTTMGLGDRRDHRPRELSTGEQQRVALARGLALDPPVLLLDEPTSALDPVTRERFQDELARLRAGRTTVLVTHDLAEAERLADRIAVLDRGRLVQVGPPEELRAHPSTPFVRELWSERSVHTARRAA